MEVTVSVKIAMARIFIVKRTLVMMILLLELKFLVVVATLDSEVKRQPSGEGRRAEFGK
jgi:hypothetical protein